MAEDSGASVVNVEFLDGTSLKLTVPDGTIVKDLIASVKAAKPPPNPNACLQLALGDGRMLTPLESSSTLIGATVNAIYRHSESAYLVKASDCLELVDEGDERWKEDVASRAFIPEEKWVPPPTLDGSVVENLAKESDGVTVKASSNIFGDQEKLNNVIRLGSKFGNPRYMPDGDNSFIFGGSDRDPVLDMDLGRLAILVRVGSMCYGDRWVNDFKVESSEDGDSWVLWGRDTKSYYHGGQIFFDREPTKARFLRFRAKSGHCPGARIGPLFAYGFVGPVPEA